MFNMDFLHKSSLRGTTLCVAPKSYMPFQQIIIHPLQCPHDVDMHLLFYFDLELHLTSLCLTWIFFLSIFADG